MSDQHKKPAQSPLNGANTSKPGKFSDKITTKAFGATRNPLPKTTIPKPKK